MFASRHAHADGFRCREYPRPPDPATRRQRETTTAHPYLIRQIELIRPQLIVALGRHAAHSLLKTEVPLGKLRGQKLSYHGTPLFVTYHPAYLLRNPADKRKVWEDLCRAKAEEGEGGEKKNSARR